MAEQNHPAEAASARCGSTGAGEDVRVGFVGLGAMGGPMARLLLDHSVDLAVFDVEVARSAPLRAGGARTAPTAAEAVAGVDLLLLMVATGRQVESVLFGPDGVLPGLKPGSTVVVLGTIGPAAIREIQGRLEEKGIGLVDAPVSGGTKRAADGSLLIMVGAEDRDFDKARGILGLLGGTVARCSSSVGGGQEVKLVNQLLCGVHIAAAGEALAMAKAMGLDAAKVMSIIGDGAAASFMLADRGPRMLADGPEVRSSVDIFVKDLGLVLAETDRIGLPVRMARSAEALFSTAHARGLGTQDDSQIVHVYDR